MSSQRIVYVKIKPAGRNYRIKNIYVPLLGNPFAELHIETYDGGGYGGSNKTFMMTDGTYRLAKGPWHVPDWDDTTFKKYTGLSIYDVVGQYIDKVLLEEV